MSRESDEQENILDFMSYRESRSKSAPGGQDDDSDLITDVRFAITRKGKLLASPPVVDHIHLLATALWCLELTLTMVHTYIEESV